MEPTSSERTGWIGRWNRVVQTGKRAQAYLTSDILERPHEEYTGWASRGHALVQFLAVTGRKFLREDCQLRASALTYVTLIAIVPVLAVALAVVKGLYLNEEKVDELMGQLETFIPQLSEGFARSAIDRIREYVRNVDAGKLGAIGALTLFATVVTTLGSVEKSLNRIWNVKKARTYLRRTVDYIAVVVLAALLLIPASAMNAASQSFRAAKKATEAKPAAVAPAETEERGVATVGPEISAAEGEPGEVAAEAEPGLLDKLVGTLSGTFWRALFRILPVFCVFLLFSFLYFFFPNTRVRPSSAALGAIAATILWQLAQYAYIAFQIGMQKANVIYGALAQLPVLLAWVYLSWLIVLIGAEIASVHQLGLKSFVLPRGREVPFSARERAGLDLVVRVSRAFRRNESPPTAPMLARELRVHQNLVEELLDTLRVLGYVRRVEEGGHGYVPGRELDQIRIFDVAHGLRETSPRAFRTRVATTEPVEHVVSMMEEGSHAAVSETTVADLLNGNIPSREQRGGLTSQASHPASIA